MATKTALFTHRYSNSNSSDDHTGSSIEATRRQMAEARSGSRYPRKTPLLDARRRQKATSTLKGAYESVVMSELAPTLKKKVSFEQRVGVETVPSSGINSRQDGMQTSPSPAARVRVWGSKSKVGSGWLNRHMQAENTETKPEPSEPLPETELPRKSSLKNFNPRPARIRREPLFVEDKKPIITTHTTLDAEIDFTEDIEVSNSPRLKATLHKPSAIPEYPLESPKGDTRLSPPRSPPSAAEEGLIDQLLYSDPNVYMSPMFKGIDGEIIRSRSSSDASRSDPYVELSPLFEHSPRSERRISGELSPLKSAKDRVAARRAARRQEREAAEAAAASVQTSKPTQSSQPPQSSQQNTSSHPDHPTEPLQPIQPTSSKLSSSEISARLSPSISASELKRRERFADLARSQSSSPSTSKAGETQPRHIRSLSGNSTNDQKPSERSPAHTTIQNEVAHTPPKIEESPESIPTTTATESLPDNIIVQSAVEPINAPDLKAEQTIAAPILIESFSTQKSPTRPLDPKTASHEVIKPLKSKATDTQIVAPIPVAPTKVHKIINTAKPASAAEDVRQILAEMDAEFTLHSADSGSLLKLNEKLQASLASIQESKRGIEAMENQVSAAPTISPTSPGIQIVVSVPRVWKYGATSWFDFTWFGWFLLILLIWLNAEDFAHCTYGRVESLGYWEPIDPTRPVWGLALPWVAKKGIAAVWEWCLD